MENKNLKTKAKEFYKKHEAVIDMIWLTGSAAMISVGCYGIGKYVGIRSVLKLPLGKYDLYSDGNKVNDCVVITIGDVLKKYCKEGKILKSMDFIDVRKL